MSLVDATWIGPWGYRLPDGTELIPGVTVWSMPRFQVDGDPYWERVVPLKSKDSTPPSGGDK